MTLPIITGLLDLLGIDLEINVGITPPVKVQDIFILSQTPHHSHTRNLDFHRFGQRTH